jgi:hypothetical protein
MPGLVEGTRKRYVQTLEQVKRPLAGGVGRSLQELDKLTAKVPYPRTAVAGPLHRLESAAEVSFEVVERVVAAQKELVLNGVGAVTSYIERPRPTSKAGSKAASKAAPKTAASSPAAKATRTAKSPTHKA